MYKFDFTNKYKKDFKKCSKRNLDFSLLEAAFKILRETGTLPFEKYKTHKLTGNYKDNWEAHIEPDWLLTWKNYNSDDPHFEGIISLTNMGTHSDLFKK